ncbi:MAG: alanine--tRNA ligase [Mahellales bacterium]|jgi:alanyl-tRNA synthetase
MKPVSLNDIRKSFLNFFKSKDHLILPSSSLIPQNDKSLLLINSGMAPLKPYFTGQETPPSKRVVTCQKCIRTPDIENVGKTARHGTFFEMLGNFSFGDYFKKEAITWAWEYVTEVLSLPRERLWISIYENDQEAFEIWNNSIGIPKERIVRLGKEDNFWEIGVGPCGPCSEIYFDRGEENGCGKKDCGVGCDCDRYIEFWNLVFTQFYRTEDGEYTKLEHPNIDTGMGLERIAAIMQGVNSLFDVDTIKSIVDYVCAITGKKYGSSSATDVSIRVITDHIRGITFMISDGILPSNEGRGYVLRRLLRRAARHGRKLGIDELFLYKVSQLVIESSCSAYPDLSDKQDYIKKVIKMEEERFQETIDLGMEIVTEYIEEMKRNNTTTLSGEKAFKLYDTYGFPLELTSELLSEQGFTVNEAEFQHQMNIQRMRARQARTETDYMGNEETNNLAGIKKDTLFTGYDTFNDTCNVVAILSDNKAIEEARRGDRVSLILDKTPFYGESGGQVGDTGKLRNRGTVIDVLECKKVGKVIVHLCKVVEGSVKTGDPLVAEVDVKARLSTARNHSATHLLHQALRDVLGTHVQQSGSLVTPERLRFDFSHFSSLEEGEIDNVERIVNERIMENVRVDVIETSMDNAVKMGATALFGEKYGNTVRVVKMGQFSMELCGGTHVKSTGEIGPFKIISETGVAAGVRRIEAVTGFEALEYLNSCESKLKIISKKLKTNINDVENRVDDLTKSIKQKEKELELLKSSSANRLIDDMLDNVKTISGMNTVVARVDDKKAEELRTIADRVKDKMSSCLVILFSVTEGKIIIIASATKDIVNKGLHCGNIARSLAQQLGGSGGGRPDMAQAGGKNIEKLDQVINNAYELIREQM